MARLARFTTYLDRLEESVVVDCEELKRKLIAQVDEQCRVVLAKVGEVRSRLARRGRPVPVDHSLFGDYPVETTVSLEQFIELQQPSTSTAQEQSSSLVVVGKKRKSQSSSGGSKKRKTRPNVTVPKKYACTHQGCGRFFVDSAHLIRHQRIHLGVKPFSCTWPDCNFAAAQRATVTRHVRSVHFNIHKSQQQRRNTTTDDDDHRDPNEYVRVDEELAKRRL